MTLQYVTLVLDAYDGAGNPVVKGSAQLVPSAPLTDAPDQMWIPQAPVPAVFRAGSFPRVTLLATDNTAPLPNGWGWTISFANVPGNPDGFTFYLPYSSGANRYLSSLVPVSSAAAMQAYMPLPSGSPLAGQGPVVLEDGSPGTVWGSAGGAVASVNGATGAVVLAASDVGAIPEDQSVTVPSGTAGTAGVVTWQVQPEGTTNAHAPFADMFLKGIYETSGADPDTEMVYSWGYNPWQLLKPGEAAIYNTIHPDAGDTDVAGARGIEWLLTFHTPDGTEINVIEVVGVKDNTGTLNLTFRHGSGADATFNPSGIYFANDTGSIEYMAMTASGGVQFYQPVGFQVAGNGLIVANASGSNAFQVEAQGGAAMMQVIAASGNAALSLSGSGNAAQAAMIQFQRNQATVWSLDFDPYAGADYFGLNDRANNRLQFYCTPGATANAAQSTFASQLAVQDSLVVSPGAALATTATHGFIYFPTCAGPPTGTPQVQAGGVAAVVDSTDGKLYAYVGGAWKAAALS